MEVDNITGAARILHVTRSAISKMLQQMGIDLGSSAVLTSASTAPSSIRSGTVAAMCPFNLRQSAVAGDGAPTRRFGLVQR
jgi:hypothetical protein